MATGVVCVFVCGLKCEHKLQFYKKYSDFAQKQERTDVDAEVHAIRRV